MLGGQAVHACKFALKNTVQTSRAYTKYQKAAFLDRSLVRRRKDIRYATSARMQAADATGALAWNA